MKFVKGIAATTIVYTVIGASVVLGTKIAQNLYENGLGDKVTKLSKKLFPEK